MKKQFLLYAFLWLPIVASAYDAHIDGIYYYFNETDKTATVIYASSSEKNNLNNPIDSGTVVIPKEVTYQGQVYSVTSIGYKAFFYCSDMTSVTIPNSVTSIGELAFSECCALTSITISNSVTTIGDRAFQGCSSLTSITIPNKVRTIGSSAFEDCYALTSITIPNSVTSIGYGTFQNCSGLTSFTIGNSVTTIGDWAFSGCSGLTSFTIGNSVTTIGYRAFSECSGLTSITIPNSVTSIGDRAFLDCSSLTSITIPNKVRTIGDGAFSSCSGLTSITIGNSVTTIGDGAFFGCSGLTSITIPNKVTSIGEGAFDRCDKLTTVEFHCKTIGSWFETNYSIKKIVIGDEVTSIGSSAFSECYGLTSVTIGNSVTTIGDGAFEDCGWLTYVEFHCKTIASWFRQSYISQVVMGDEVKSIGDSAFSGCNFLTSVTIGNRVTSISPTAFENAFPEKTIWLPNTPPSGYQYVEGTVNYVSNDSYTELGNKKIYPFLSSMFEVEGVVYVPVNPSERTCDAIDCVYDASVEHINIDKSVSYKGVTLNVLQVNPFTFYDNPFIKDVKLSISGGIGDYAFGDCKLISSAILEDNISKIGRFAFQNCSFLQSVAIPNSCASLGDSSFSGCSDLADVKIGSGVTEIGENAFKSCASLPAISIPENVKVIGNYVFSGCEKLSVVVIEDRGTTLTLGSNDSSPLFADCPLDSVFIGGDISYKKASNYGYSPFYRNTSLRSVIITDKETEVSDNEFYGCTNLKNVKIGDDVTTIGKWAFSGCSSLDFFAFGRRVADIGEEAFSDCTGVRKIISHASTPPRCGTQALDDINKWTCTLFVPQGSLPLYQAANQWKEFFFVNEEVPTGVALNDVREMQIHASDGFVSVTGIADGQPIAVYRADGTQVCSGTSYGGTATLATNLAKGSVAIVRVGNKSVKIVIR